MDYETIRSNLATLLGTITSLAYVYTSREPNVEGYPSAILDLTDLKNEPLTNIENLHQGVFKIFLIQELVVEGGAVNSNQILDGVTQDVVAKLEDRANIGLSGSVDWIEPVVGKREEIQTPQGIAFSQEITVTFYKSVSTL